MEFLGHRVSSKGRRPLPTTLSKISKFPRPLSRKEVWQFMGLVNWYRDYIPSVSDTADPLLALTNKGTEWLWTEECECSYQKLRTQLINEPQLLAFPDWTVPFYIETDASGIAVGPVLSQDDVTGRRRILEFCSSKLNDAQRERWRPTQWWLH